MQNDCSTRLNMAQMALILHTFGVKVGMLKACIRKKETGPENEIGSAQGVNVHHATTMYRQCKIWEGIPTCNGISCNTFSVLLSHTLTWNLTMNTSNATMFWSGSPPLVSEAVRLNVAHACPRSLRNHTAKHSVSSCLPGLCNVFCAGYQLETQRKPK